MSKNIENFDENVRNVSKEVGIAMSIANTLRGPYKADKYKDVIIPMLVIRRVECALEKTKDKVLAEYTKNKKAPELILRKKSGYDFYNVSKFNLASVAASKPQLIVTNLKSYINGFSPNIKDILKSLEFEKQIEKMYKNDRLVNVITKFSNFDLYPDHVSNIKMGYIFEEIIRRFSEKGGEAGDHYTPREVIRLLVKLMLAEGCEDIKKEEKIITVLDMACGTGGMLSTTYEEIHNHINETAKLELFGQEVNPESYAICLSDMLIKGQKAENIKLQDTMKKDCFEKQSMRFVIANPPFGEAWGGKDAADGVEQAVKDEYKKGKGGRFFAGLPGTGDMQLLFMQHAIYKMDNGTGRAAIITNGSPLFAGQTTSGESQIRRYMLENDLIEAIIALPSDLFYNTSISIYVFVLSKNKRQERKNKIQLINAVNFYEPLKKSLGKKRKEITNEQIEEILEMYLNFDRYAKKPSEKCKVFDKNEFLYKEWSVYQPLQRSGSISKTNIQKLKDSALFNANSHIFNQNDFDELKEKNPRSDKDEKKYQKYILDKKFTEEVITQLLKNASEQKYDDFNTFTQKVKTIIKNIKGYTPSRLNQICMELSSMDKKAVIQKDSKGIVIDSTTKDTEIIKLNEDVEKYFKKEVYPHVPDAIYDVIDNNEDNEKIGAELPFTKFFYKYEKPKESSEYLKELIKLEKEANKLIEDL